MGKKHETSAKWCTVQIEGAIRGVRCNRRMPCSEHPAPAAAPSPVPAGVRALSDAMTPPPAKIPGRR